MTNENESRIRPYKPVGIILSTLYFAIVQGLLTIYSSILLFEWSSSSAGLTLMAITWLALGVFSLAVSYGLWYTIEWGRKYGIAICVISIPLSFVYSGEATAGRVVLIVSSIVIEVLVIWYLSKNDVKLLFSEANA